MRPLRHLPYPNALVEITSKTCQDRLLLRPSPLVNERLAGVLAKAQAITGMIIHSYVFLSNHYHLLISPESVAQMSAFMGHLNANISKEIKRIHGWSGPVFSQRYRAIVITGEEEAHVARLRYSLEQGTKENLVATPESWPGLHCVGALTRNELPSGTWIDRTDRHRRGGSTSQDDSTHVLSILLSPLPCWAGLDQDTRARRVQEIVNEIEADTRRRHRSQRTRPLGVRRILRANPHDQAKPSVRRPAPRVHAFRRGVRLAFEQAYRSFYAAFREAAKRLADGDRSVRFPPDCFPPRLPVVPPEPSVIPI